MSILICRCGMWLKPPERGSGGVGRCPRCGRFLGVSGEEVTPSAAEAAIKRPRRQARPLRGRPLGIAEVLAYPILDGPGLALLICFPPLLAFLSVPVFDVVLLFQSGPRGGFNPLALMILPIATPLIISFVMIFGYALLYLGRVLTSSAMGETEHPRFPLWDRHTIFEGLARWIWAALIGAGVGGLPILLYWRVCGTIDLLDRIIIAELLAIGAGYAQMGLAAAILHDNIASANPITIARAIYRIGWDYLWPCLTTAVALTLGFAAWYAVMYHAPNLSLAAVGLWAFWVFVLYEAMVVMRVLGWCYFRHGAALGWFRVRPKWGSWERPGRIYSNS
ncbi:hypothetical protein BH23PLA1_BH23PLA1_05630 [soil metagenome]